jgi:DNA-binding CsgD family transcriptional regulator
MGLLELDDFLDGLLVALRETVPSDWSAMHELPAELPNTVSITVPPVPDRFHERFAELAPQNPLVDYFMRTRDGQAIRISDLMSRRELHQLDLYRDIYAPLGIEYQIAFMLPSREERILGIALSRQGRDFTQAERDLLNLARPYLIEAYRTALAYTRISDGAGRGIALEDLHALGLTSRQAEVLRLVAMGRSDQDAAAELGIAVRTAQKHLERSYRVLGVTSRSAAARRAWATVSGEQQMA